MLVSLVKVNDVVRRRAHGERAHDLGNAVELAPFLPDAASGVLGGMPLRLVFQALLEVTDIGGQPLFHFGINGGLFLPHLGVQMFLSVGA